MTLDAAERLVRIVVRLLDQSQLLPLDGVKPRVYRVVLLQALQSQDQELRQCDKRVGTEQQQAQIREGWVGGR